MTYLSQMDENNLYKEVASYIAKDEIETALSTLSSHLGSSKEVLIITARYKELNEAFDKGFISFPDKAIQKNIIRHTVLSIAQDYEKIGRRKYNKRLKKKGNLLMSILLKKKRQSIMWLALIFMVDWRRVRSGISFIIIGLLTIFGYNYFNNLVFLDQEIRIGMYSYLGGEIDYPLSKRIQRQVYKIFPPSFDKKTINKRNLHYMYLKGDLSRLNLKCSNLKKSFLDVVSFRNSNLYKSNFESATCRGVDFEGANLSNVNFENAILKGTMIDVLINSHTNFDNVVFHCDYNNVKAPDSLTLLLFNMLINDSEIMSKYRIEFEDKTNYYILTKD